jgi:hypothetical protein
MNAVEAAHNSSARLRSARRRSARSSSPGMVRVCPPARGRPDYAVLVSGKSLPMVNAGDEVLRCARPGCEKEPRPGEAGAAEQGYCGLPGPVTGEPHLALTGFRWRR